MRHTHPLTLTLLGCLAIWACSKSTDLGSQQSPDATGAHDTVTAGSSPGQDATGGSGTSAAADKDKSGAAGKRGDSGTASGSQTAGTGGSEMAAEGGSGDAPSAGGSGGAGEDNEDTTDASDDPFDMCVASLKPLCNYDEKETACAGMTTTSIPLTDGSSWGNTEIKGGPYGAYVEWNQGEDFANPVNSSESSCDVIAATFGEPQSVTADVLDLRGADLSLYTIFRPACMKDGETYPVITWGNGTCGQTGGYAPLLATVASHGFVVIAANSRFTDAGNDEMLKALDLAKALNEDSSSEFYQRLDLDNIGAMGHSQGASATAHAASDPRVKAVILWNGPDSADKPFLAVSGDRDITSYTPQGMASDVNGASQPGAWLFYHQILETGGSVTGHLTLMEQPERVVEPAIAWWQYMLKGDEEAKKLFVGDDCGLCNHKDEYEFGAHNLP